MTMHSVKKNSKERINNFLKVLIIIVYAFLLFPVYCGTLSSGLDTSWQYFLNRMICNKKYLFGRDIVFTYGILGFLQSPLNMNHNMIFAYMIYMLLYLGTLYIIIKLFKNNVVCFKRMILALAIIWMAQSISHSVDVFIEYCMMLSLCYIFYDCKDKVVNVLFVIYAIIAFYYKTSMGVPLVGSILVLFVYGYYHEKYSKKERIIPALIIVLIPMTYLVYNPSLLDLYKYIRGSMEFASGFNVAMSVPYCNSDMILAIVYLVVYLVIGINQIYKKHYYNMWLMLIIFPELFIAYKYGIVRADPDHVIISYSEIYLLIAIVIIFWKDNVQEIENTDDDSKILKGKRLEKNYVLLVVLCLLGVLLYKPLNVLKFKTLYLGRLINSYRIADSNKDVNVYSIPQEFIEIIGSSSYTSFPWEIAFIERMKDKSDNFIPLPCLQIYACYTPYLEKITSDFIDDNGPQYIIIDLETIDGRIPLLETTSVWNSIYDNYRYVMNDGNLVLLKREKYSLNNSNKKGTKYLHDKNAVIVVDDCDEIEIQMDLNFIGKILGLFYKIPDVQAIIVYDDEKAIYGRIIPSSLNSGIRCSGLPYDSNEFIKCLNKNSNTHKISKIQIYGSGLKFYEKDYILNKLTND